MITSWQVRVIIVTIDSHALRHDCKMTLTITSHASFSFGLYNIMHKRTSLWPWHLLRKLETLSIDYHITCKLLLRLIQYYAQTNFVMAVTSPQKIGNIVDLICMHLQQKCPAVWSFLLRCDPFCLTGSNCILADKTHLVASRLLDQDVIL